MQVEMIKTRSGYPTCKVHYFDTLLHRDSNIYLCSRFNPYKEAEEWAEKTYKEEIKCFFIYGLGLGYHIGALARKLKENQKIQVIECHVELMDLIEEYIDESVKQNPLITIWITNKMEKVVEIFKNIDDKTTSFGIYQPSLQIMPRELNLLQESLQNFYLNQVAKKRFKEEIQENYYYNDSMNYNNISQLYGCWRNNPIIIVSAGPSLDQNIHKLKNVPTHIKIFSTGRSLKTLVENQVRVDMFCIIDPHKELTAIQIEGMESLGIPFVFLNTVSYYTVEKYKGPKYMAYSMDYPIEQEGRIESGGSVATAMLDLALKFGGDPIIFVGQDLAYTNGETHSSGARSDSIKALPNMKRVKGSDGTYIPTTSGLLSFKHWIENKIKKHPQVKFYNCSEGGAYIEGCQHESLLKILQDLMEMD